MCKMVYLASGNLLPNVPCEASESDNRLCFSVTYCGDISEGDQVLRSVFSKQHIYSVSSHSLWHCGCYFEYGDGFIVDEEDAAEQEERRTILQRFREYIEDALKLGPVEVYVENVGNQEIETVEISRSTVAPDHFSGDSFEFRERELLSISG